MTPLDFNQCQTERPSTWPRMPSFMTLGPVDWNRCENTPTWIATDTVQGGSMSLCDECKVVMEELHPTGQIEVARLVPDYSKATAKANELLVDYESGYCTYDGWNSTSCCIVWSPALKLVVIERDEFNDVIRKIVETAMSVPTQSDIEGS